LAAGLAAVGAQLISRSWETHSSCAAGEPLSLCVLAWWFTLLLGIQIKCGVTKEWCVCIGETEHIIPFLNRLRAVLGRVALPEVSFGTIRITASNDTKEAMLGVSSQKVIDCSTSSAARQCRLARGLNDTPKIVALVIVIRAVGIRWGMIAVAWAWPWVDSSALAGSDHDEQEITPLNHGQGFTANLVTAVLVIFGESPGLAGFDYALAVGLSSALARTRQANPRGCREY